MPKSTSSLTLCKQDTVNGTPSVILYGFIIASGKARVKRCGQVSLEVSYMRHTKGPRAIAQRLLLLHASYQFSELFLVFGKSIGGVLPVGGGQGDGHKLDSFLAYHNIELALKLHKMFPVNCFQRIAAAFLRVFGNQITHPIISSRLHCLPWQIPSPLHCSGKWQNLQQQGQNRFQI